MGDYTYTDGKKLLQLLKPSPGNKRKEFSEIPFDDIPFVNPIFNRINTTFALPADVSPSTELINIILCGPPGSGKSTIKTELLSNIGYRII
jgi:hypothetical protein